MEVLAPNTLVQNRYLIIQLLGKGETGEVYLAVDQRLGNAVVLKRVSFFDEAIAQGFEHQAETLTRLRHPVLPRVEAKFSENNFRYLIAEHIQGDDLAHRLKVGNQPFPASWVLFWGDQLLDALAYLHSHEPAIIHGDIKPQNLKLNDENNIFLLDFGLFGRRNGIDEGTVLQDDKSNYASREQLRGMQPTPRSDIYSLSATLYTLLTNTVPPDAAKRADTVLSSLPDPLKSVNELNPEVSRAVSDIVLKGMSLNADARYQTAREMQKALRDAYAGIQEVMTAQTVAFNVADIQPIVESPVPGAGQLPPENDYYGHSVPVNSPGAVPLPAEAVSVAANGNALAEKNFQDAENGFANKDFQEDVFREDVPVPDFNSTVPFNSALSTDDVFASNGKDEVFPNSPSVEPNTAFTESPKTDSSKIAPVEFKEENFSPVYNHQDFKENYAAESTVPLISFDGKSNEILKEPVTDIPPDIPKELPVANTAVNIPISPELKAEIADDRAAKNFSKVTTEKSKSSAPPLNAGKPVPPKQIGKKSNGKIFAILGAVLGVIILGSAAAAVGLYMIKPSIFTSATPTPVPTVEPTVEPVVQPTIEPTPDTALGNTETNTNTNTDVANTNVNTNAETETVQTGNVKSREKTATVRENSPAQQQRPEPGTTERPVTTPRITVPPSGVKIPKPPPTKTPIPNKKPTVKGPETL